MFRRRATQPEHFDDASRTAEEFREAYRELARVNRLFRLDDPYTRVMSRQLGPKNCRDLSILDLGAGDGWLGRQMEDYARGRGWCWRVANLDANPAPLSLRRGGCNVAASALALPFEDNAFDVVIASQMTHHLNSDAEVILHFQEAWRVARAAVFLSDMRRGAFLYLLLRITLPLLRLSDNMVADGLLSVRKSWRAEEWRQLADQAGLRSATVTNYFGTRVILTARKPLATVEASGTSAAYRGADGFCSARSGK